MHAYVINLVHSVDRRVYMENVLKDIPSLNYEFIPAVDVRNLSEEKQIALFDKKHSEMRFARRILPAEIGCTLSHQLCYKQLLASDRNYALILEDDIILKGDLEKHMVFFDEFMNCDQPKIFLLSGYVWFFNKRKLKDITISKVYNALLTHAYIINKAAAQMIIEERPFIRADNWLYIRKKGVQIYSIVPHIINQDCTGKFSSTIYSKNPLLKCYPIARLRIHLNGLILKLFKLIGHFEPPV